MGNGQAGTTCSHSDAGTSSRGLVNHGLLLLCLKPNKFWENLVSVPSKPSASRFWRAFLRRLDNSDIEMFRDYERKFTGSDDPIYSLCAARMIQAVLAEAKREHQTPMDQENRSLTDEFIEFATDVDDLDVRYLDALWRFAKENRNRTGLVLLRLVSAVDYEVSGVFAAWQRWRASAA